MNIPAINFLDGYKTDHRRQYPKGTEVVYANFTPRGTRTKLDSVVFFGLQYFIKEYLINQYEKTFFSKQKADAVSQYKRRMDNYLGKNAVPVEHIEELHDLGYLPICIKAVKEGTRVPLRCPMLTIVNTKDKFYWLTNYLETLLSTCLWQPCTSASTAAEYRRVFNYFADKTVGNRDLIPFQCHDFSFRGMPGVEAACMSGAAHLLSFVGTDTIPAIDFLEQYYYADSDNELVGCSVPATEHSVATLGILSRDESLTLLEREKLFVKRMITEVYPTGIVSLVSDSFDYWGVITTVLPELNNQIMNRDGKLVVRPDSGVPEDVICGDLKAEVGSPQYKGSIECLWETFGGTITPKGYKQLDPHIGLIYGDSITLERQYEILDRLEKKGFASSNIVLGVGSYSYQYVTRDTHQFAVKATYGEVDGVPINIYKKPKTDSGMKNSAKGLLSVVKGSDGKLELLQECSWETESTGLLEIVFEDGQLVRRQTLAGIRKIMDENQ